MRKGLRKIGNSKYYKFTAVFKRFGVKKNNISEATVLLLYIRDEHNKLVTGHIWFDCTDSFKNLNLKEGDKIEFKSRVGVYVKQGSFGMETDYNLETPTQIHKLDSPTQDNFHKKDIKQTDCKKEEINEKRIKKVRRKHQRNV